MTHVRLTQFLTGLTAPGTCSHPVGSAAEPSLRAAGVAEVLKAGRLAYVAVDTKRGPFVTPVLYGVAGDRLWLLTRRGTLKARLLHARPQAGLLIRDADRSVVMQGEVRLLEPVRPRGLAAAASETAVAPFGLLSWVARNQREVFGFTVDAPRILAQLAPQNIVLVSFRPNRVALVRDQAVEAASGTWPTPVPGDPAQPIGSIEDGGVPRIQADAALSTSDLRVLAQPLPAGLAELPGQPGQAVVGLRTPGGPLALPAVWDPASGRALIQAGLAAAVPSGTAVPASVTFDEPDHTRPTEQRGLMLRGTGRIHTAGSQQVLSIDAERVTYWDGFATGTLNRAALTERAAS